jgi:hypothetical protein
MKEWQTQTTNEDEFCGDQWLAKRDSDPQRDRSGGCAGAASLATAARRHIRRVRRLQFV